MKLTNPAPFVHSLIPGGIGKSPCDAHIYDLVFLMLSASGQYGKNSSAKY
jgi:hypothetical protein